MIGGCLKCFGGEYKDMGLCPDYRLPESEGNSTTGYLNITYEEVKPNKAKTVTSKEAEVQSLILASMGMLDYFSIFQT